MSHTLPGWDQLVGPMEEGIICQKSQEQVALSEKIQEEFYSAQKSLSSNQAIVFPRPADQLWIVTSGSAKHHEVGVTLCNNRQHPK